MALRGFKKFLTWVVFVLGLVTSFAIGGLFISGSLMSNVILDWVPLVVHQVVGWAIIATAIIGGILHLMK